MTAFVTSSLVRSVANSSSSSMSHTLNAALTKSRAAFTDAGSALKSRATCGIVQTPGVTDGQYPACSRRKPPRRRSAGALASIEPRWAAPTRSGQYRGAPSRGGQDRAAEAGGEGREPLRSRELLRPRLHAVVCVAAAFVDEKTAETWRVPLSQARMSAATTDRKSTRL